MAGLKGASGRKGYQHERLVKELIDRGANICLKALKREGEFQDLEIPVWLELASRFAIKAIPQNFEFRTEEVKRYEIISGLTTDDLKRLIEAGGIRALPPGTA